MGGHNLCFYGEIWKLFLNYPGYPFLSGALNLLEKNNVQTISTAVIKEIILPKSRTAISESIIFLLSFLILNIMANRYFSKGHK